MYSPIVSFAYLFGVGVLWGGTNPFLKKSTAGVDKIKYDSKIKTFFSEVKYFFCNWKYLIPFVLNQCGSVLYFFTLQNTELSLAVPVANSLTFVFTWIVGMALGEKPADKISFTGTIFGMILILFGITLCFLDKL
ncbi:hypothetical protein J437_LFUL001089 [Ladona fulva]|uniref:Transmembrane protein 234 homolog n=1 Tax=Ladona fulva TaxID=123851 RepID=A0A8K0JWN4_LADFU|nr:hypothetical protein J437_LFUL001089 [Ladona fulva]